MADPLFLKLGEGEALACSWRIWANFFMAFKKLHLFEKNSIMWQNQSNHKTLDARKHSLWVAYMTPDS